MNLDEIQPRLKTLLEGIEALEDVAEHILIDDGTKDEISEASLTEEGLSILILPPKAIQQVSSGRGVTSLRYATEIQVRTNPKIKVANVTKWNPMTLEKAIIPAVLQFGMAPVNFFELTEGMLPDTDYTDVGNDTRLINFSTNVILQ